MSIRNIFKPKWSANRMSPEDRQKLFWYLKRRTSYTAWQRVAEAFDNFAEIFEQQVRLEPITKRDSCIFETNWEHYFPEVLKGQVLYEKGLAALRNGDRTVWLYNERGLLDDAETIAGRWYVALVNHGPHGDIDLDGRYLVELTDAMKRFSKISHDTCQVIQPRMAETPAPYAWTTYWQDDFAALPLPEVLPDPPVPKAEILVRSGEIAPVFGIYEPQVEDGCMNYLLGTIPAPSLWESDGTSFTGRKLPVTWRLIWEDTRYINSPVPEEETSYFPTEPLPALSQSKPAVQDLLSAFTNEICPASGEWAVMDDLQATSRFARGERVPSHKEREVFWVWLRD